MLISPLELEDTVRRQLDALEDAAGQTALGLSGLARQGSAWMGARWAARDGIFGCSWYFMVRIAVYQPNPTTQNPQHPQAPTKQQTNQPEPLGFPRELSDLPPWLCHGARLERLSLGPGATMEAMPPGEGGARLLCPAAVLCPHHLNPDPAGEPNWR